MRSLLRNGMAIIVVLGVAGFAKLNGDGASYCAAAPFQNDAPTEKTASPPPKEPTPPPQNKTLNEAAIKRILEMQRIASETPLKKFPRETPWTTSRITGSPEPPPPYTLDRLFPHLQFTEPLDVVAAPGTDRLFVAEMAGKIYSFPNDQECRQPDMFFDLTRHVQDLKAVYGIVFHPGFQQNGFVYICYALSDWTPNGTKLSRFRISASDPPRCDPTSETVLLEWLSGGHNGGCLQFGPDGCLYVATGDSANPNPPDGLDTGQDISDLLSSILRIDVDNPQEGRAYGIPSDNPFVSFENARPEVWAYGFRNPWRMSFDRATGDLWAGDVGWELWEMVYRIERGGNYGWSVMEGHQPVRPEAKRGPTPILPPVFEHSHTEGRSITGGYVYRGQRLPELEGVYIYGDFETGKIWGLRYDGQQVTYHKELASTNAKLVSFGETGDGELLILDHVSGTLNQLAANRKNVDWRNFPRKLSETGLFSSVSDEKPAAGVVEYTVNAQPWEDHAVARRLIGLPGDSQITVELALKFPVDAVLAKTLSLDMKRGDPATRRRLETQVLHYDGATWNGYTYVWNDEQSDAYLADSAGAEKSFSIIDPDAPGGRSTQTWRFHSRSECMLCHNLWAGFELGFGTWQLAAPKNSAAASKDTAAGNQLEQLSHIGIFDRSPPEFVPRMVDPHDESADLTSRVRAYLHTNCAHCHRFGGGGTADFSLPYNTTLEESKTIGVRPSQGTFGIAGARIIAPGDPYRSVMLYRMAKLGRGHMPHIGSTFIDEWGVDLIFQWISSLPENSGEPEPSLSFAPIRAKQHELIERLRSGADPSGDGQAAAVDQLLSDTSGALMLLRGIDDGKFGMALRRAILDQALAVPNPLIRELFERFVPVEQRTKTLGTVVNAADILSHPGDAGRGAKIFFETEGIQCKSCHRIRGNGTELGPDLSEIGKKYNRAQLLETILEPSKAVDAKYLTYVLETKSGKLYSGLLAEKSDQAVVLKTTENKPIRVTSDDVELLVTQQKSLMPELLLRDMTIQDVADLLEYLASLKD